MVNIKKKCNKKWQENECFGLFDKRRCPGMKRNNGPGVCTSKEDWGASLPVEKSIRDAVRHEDT